MMKLNIETSSPRIDSNKNYLREIISNDLSDIDKDEWDSVFADAGLSSYNGLLYQRKTFYKNNEYTACQFYYYLVKDHKNNIVTAAFFTVGLMKNDLVMDPSISQVFEERRKTEPLFQTSPCILFGSPLSSSTNLYINEESPRLDQAIEMLSSALNKIKEKSGARAIIVRDIPENTYPKAVAYLQENGFMLVTAGIRYEINNIRQESTEDYLKTIPHNYKRKIRLEILPFEKLFSFSFEKNLSSEDIEACYQLYKNVKRKSLTFNTFELPKSAFINMIDDRQWDIFRLYMKKDQPGAPQAPLAVGFNFNDGYSYNAHVIGLNYDYVNSHNIYKQTVYQVLVRARELGLKKLNLGYTGDLVKKKIGGQGVNCQALVKLNDDFMVEIMQQMQSDE